MSSVRAAIRSNTQAGRPVFSTPVVVESLEPVSANFVRVSVRGESLDYPDPWPADGFRLALPADGRGSLELPAPDADGQVSWPPAQQPITRGLTVRRYDAAERRICFDVVTHPGLTYRWLQNARPGDQVAVIGIRREFYAAAGVDHHLIVGDTSALPAIASILDGLAEDLPTTAVVTAEDDSDLALLTPRGKQELTGLRVHGAEQVSAALLGALHDLPRPEGRIQAWVAGETAFVRQARRVLLEQWQLPRDDVQASAYWTLGHDSDQSEAKLIKQYESAIAKGLDLTDPDVADELAFG